MLAKGANPNPENKFTSTPQVPQVQGNPGKRRMDPAKLEKLQKERKLDGEIDYAD